MASDEALHALLHPLVNEKEILESTENLFEIHFPSLKVLDQEEHAGSTKLIVDVVQLCILLSVRITPVSCHA